MTDEEYARRYEHLRVTFQQIGQIGAYITRAMPEIARLMHLLGADISAWALAQGPAPELSPALHYCAPAIRRRMAKRRARLVTRHP